MTGDASRSLRISQVGLRGVVGTALTATHALDFASAFGTFLEPGGRVIIGRDPRASGVMMREAVMEMRYTHGVDFGLLFCEPRHAPLYKRLGWRFFEGEVFVEQPRQGRVRFSVIDAFVFDLKIAPRAGILDLCGLPW